MKRPGSFCLLIVIGVFAIGCGGDDEEPLSKAAFIEQGNAICGQGNSELDAASADFGRNTPPAEIESFVTDTLVPNVQDQVDQLRELTPPEGDEDTVEAIFDAADEGIATAEEDPAAFTEPDGDPFAEANRLARKYGLTVCGG